MEANATTKALIITGVIIFCIVPPAVIGATSPIQKSKGWQRQRPPLAPPAVVFPIVWFILYALAAAALCLQLLVPEKGVTAAVQYTGVALLAAQLIIGFAWPIVWNKGNTRGAAYMIVAMLALAIPGVILATKTNLVAGALWSPLLAWLVFALVLTAQRSQVS